jgi:hypothetical protein
VTALRVVLEELGACERALEELGRQRETLPAEIASAEAKAQAARDALAGERERSHALELAIQDCEARRAKLQGQTALVKTNVEYRALLGEIEGQSGRISELEEEVLLLLEQTEGASARLLEIEREQHKLEQIFVQEAEAARRRLAEVEGELDRRGKERETRVANLPANARAVYQHVTRRRSTGVAEIRAGICGACHREIPPETINRTLAGELHTCPACQRLLVHPVA